MSEAIADGVERHDRCLARRLDWGVQRAVLVESDGQSGARADGEDSQRGCRHRHHGFPAQLGLEENLHLGRRRAGDFVWHLRIDLAVLRVEQRCRRSIELAS